MLGKHSNNNTGFLIVILSPEGPPTTDHPAGPIQPNSGFGRHVPTQVSGVWGPRAYNHLAEEWSQPVWKGHKVFPSGTWQPSDPEYQGGLC